MVTVRKGQFALVSPIIHRLLRNKWNVRVVQCERFWEQIEHFLLKKRSLTSFYTSNPQKTESKTSKYALRFLPRILLFLTKMVRLERPDVLVVMTEGVLPAQVAVAMAHLRKVPTFLFLQALGVVGYNYGYNLLCDRIAVPCILLKDLIVKSGVSEERIRVTGRPIYDVLCDSEKRFDKTAICEELGLEVDKKILVYCTDNLPQNQVMTFAICKAVQNFSDLQFVIKVHPSEPSISMYKKLCGDLGLQSVITKDVDIYKVLYVCDLLITGFSTTVLDAMILKKPVITVNLTGLPDPIPFAESKVAIGVYHESDIEKAIRNGLYSCPIKPEDRERFVFEQAFLTDGKATERVVTSIEQMVREHFERLRFQKVLKDLNETWEVMVIEESRLRDCG